MTAGTSWQSCFGVFYLQNILAVSGLPSPSAGDLPSPGIEPRSLARQADPLPSESWGKPLFTGAELRCQQGRLPGRLQALCRPGGQVPFHRPAGLSLCLPVAPPTARPCHKHVGNQSYYIGPCDHFMLTASVKSCSPYDQIFTNDKKKSFHFPKHWGLGIQYSVLVGRTQFYPLPPLHVLHASPYISLYPMLLS